MQAAASAFELIHQGMAIILGKLLHCSKDFVPLRPCSVDISL